MAKARSPVVTHGQLANNGAVSLRALRARQELAERQTTEEAQKETEAKDCKIKEQQWPPVTMVVLWGAQMNINLRRTDLARSLLSSTWRLKAINTSLAVPQGWILAAPRDSGADPVCPYRCHQMKRDSPKEEPLSYAGLGP